MLLREEHHTIGKSASFENFRTAIHKREHKARNNGMCRYHITSNEQDRYGVTRQDNELDHQTNNKLAYQSSKM